jgi:hypothetical protein
MRIDGALDFLFHIFAVPGEQALPSTACLGAFDRRSGAGGKGACSQKGRNVETMLKWPVPLWLALVTDLRNAIIASL